MSHWQAKMLFLDVTNYSVYDDAHDDGQAFRKQLNKWCSEKDYSLIGVIGVSEHNLDAGEMHYGYRGKKEFIKTKIFDFITDESKRPYIQETVWPHLHIVLFCTPGKTLREDIKDYFKTKGREVFISEIYDYNVTSMLSYTMLQSTDCFKIHNNVSGLPQAALDEFVKSAESVNRYMGANKPVFFRLPLSQQYFKEDNSVLEEDNSEVFAEYCLNQERLEIYRAEQNRLLELMRRNRKLKSEVSTTDSDDNSELFTASPNDSSEVFTNQSADSNISNTTTISLSDAQSEVFTNQSTPNDNKKHSKSLDFLDGLSQENTPSELVIYNIYNTPYNPSFNKPRAHAPPIPQNVIDGLVCFLETLSPLGEIF